MKEIHEPMEEPLWPWQTERLVKASELIGWTADLPSDRLCLSPWVDQGANPRFLNGLLVGTVFIPGVVFAADPTNGSMVWSQTTGYSAEPSIAVDEECVYAGPPDHIRAICLSDGHTRWEFSPEMEGNSRIYSAPVVAENEIFLTDLLGRLHKLNKLTGERQWSTQIDPQGARANASIVLVGDLLVSGTNSGTVAATDTASGEVVWRAQLSGPVQQLQSYGQQVLSGTRQALTVLDAANGSVISEWAPKGEEIRVSRVVDGGILMVLSSIKSKRTPLAPQMKYQPERLVYLDESFVERWSVPYPPYSGPMITYDTELQTVIEATAGGLGFVDIHRGVRKCLVYGFPRRTEFPHDRVSIPCRVCDHLYGLTNQGTLFQMRVPKL